MSSPYQCSPPFHLDPGYTRAQATSFYLVSSPAALENRGIYTSWGVPPSSPPEKLASLCGMPAATPGSMPTLRAPPSQHAWSLPGPPRPRPTAPLLRILHALPLLPLWCLPALCRCSVPLVPPSVSTALHMRTPAGLHSTLSTKRGVSENLSLVVNHFPPLPWSLRCGPRTPPPALDPPLNATQTYVVRGSGTIHTSLEDALAHFNIAAARGQATLCAPDNPWVATHVAAGHTLEEARALVCLGNLEGQILKEEYAYDSDNKYWRNS
ncbi:hypothetical protein K438DRAFT_1977691 [Mycena galopus ATCC 62051]|nr:hypothetical protein K438DRAFT_1977691 [Mycena galopus ATCC 62051]